MKDVYCTKCRKETQTLDVGTMMSANRRPMLTGRCGVCGQNKKGFMKRGDYDAYLRAKWLTPTGSGAPGAP